MHVNVSNSFVSHHSIVLCDTSLNSFLKGQMQYLFSILSHEFNFSQKYKKMQYLFCIESHKFNTSQRQK